MSNERICAYCQEVATLKCHGDEIRSGAITVLNIYVCVKHEEKAREGMSLAKYKGWQETTAEKGFYK